MFRSIIGVVALATTASVAWSPAASPGAAPDHGIPTPDGRHLSPAQIDHFVQQQMAELDIPGISIAVIADGEIAYHRVFGIADRETGQPITDQSIFEAASLSKPVFAAFVMTLVDRGEVDLDTPLYQIAPFTELANDPRYQRVTARMVLNHTSGFPNWRWFDLAPDSLGIRRGTMYLKAEPGSFTYSGEAYHYLARAIAHQTGRDETTLDALINEVVAEPFGISSFHWTWDPSLDERKVMGHRGGESVGRAWPMSFPDDDSTRIGVAGRLHTEASDYARFLVELMEGDLVSTESREAMLSVQSRVPPDSYDYRENGIVAWGLGVALEPTPWGTRYRHGGNNGGYQSAWAYFREKRIGYVFMTNSDGGEQFNRRLEPFLATGEWSGDSER